jgi:hypothetical protein
MNTIEVEDENIPIDDHWICPFCTDTSNTTDIITTTICMDHENHKDDWYIIITQNDGQVVS